MASLVADEAGILANLAHTRHGLVGETWLVTITSEIMKQGQMMYNRVFFAKWSVQRKFWSVNPNLLPSKILAICYPGAFFGSFL